MEVPMRPGIEKTAVVTGAGSGLGRSLCVELARRGWRLGAVDMNAEAARQTVRLVQVEAMASHFFEAFGAVGMLFNNAGIGAGGDVGELPMDQWRRVVDTNLWGVINGCHVFIPRMKAHGSGHIVNTGSIGAFVALPGVSPYCVSKAGVIALSETLRSELAPHNIGVTVTCPSFFKTNIIETTTFGEDFQRELLELAFASAKMDCDEVARRVLGHIEKNRLYSLPQASAWFSWLNKRFAPVLMVKAWSWLNRRGWLERVLKMSVRGGW
jgi:NAD(P)-dependent dehydrogenase (short-subunit alcohol dehydrogenase family)